MTMMSTPKAEPRRARPFSFCFFFQYGFSRGGERKNKGQGRFTSRSKHRHVNALKTTPVFVEMLLAASPFPRATAFQLFRPSEHRPDRANAIISRLKLNNSRISRLCPPRRRSRKKKKNQIGQRFWASSAAASKQSIRAKPSPTGLARDFLPKVRSPWPVSRYKVPVLGVGAFSVAAPGRWEGGIGRREVFFFFARLFSFDYPSPRILRVLFLRGSALLREARQR